MATESIVRDFYCALDEGRILGIKCRDCGEYSFPPKTACAECGSRAIDTVELSGKGKLLYYSSGNLPPLRFADFAPYAYGLVRLEEGPMWLTMIRGVDVGDAAQMERCAATLPRDVTAKIAFVAGTNIVTFEVAAEA
jgi:uncharacterized protein